MILPDVLVPIVVVIMKTCTERASIQELLTVVQDYRVNLTQTDGPKDLHLGVVLNSTEEPDGTIVRWNNDHLACALDGNLIYLNPVGTPIVHWLDQFYLKSGMISNYTKEEPILTTVGRYLINYLVFAEPFGDRIPYINSLLSTGTLGSIYAKSMMTKLITVPEFEHSIDQFFFIGHMTELCSSSMTPKSLLTSPEVAKIKKRFMEEHKHELDDPFVAKLLEDEVEKVDKEYLGDDPSVRFFNALGEKSYNIHRKKMFLTVGCIDAFDDVGGKYNFIPNALTEGWSKESFAVLCNEIRKGSYSRGIETAIAGAETKDLLRVFQDVRIIEDDCKTKDGLLVDFSRYNINNFIGQYIFESDGSYQLLSDANKAKYDKRKIVIRSPQYCKSQRGYCAKCFGNQFELLNSKNVGALTISITATYLYFFMKNMHGTAIKIYDVDLDKFFL